MKPQAIHHKERKERREKKTMIEFLRFFPIFVIFASLRPFPLTGCHGEPVEPSGQA
jgi:hypothetical protein